MADPFLALSLSIFLSLATMILGTAALIFGILAHDRPSLYLPRAVREPYDSLSYAWRSVDVEKHFGSVPGWNSAFAAFGGLVGVVAAAALVSHDDYLRRNAFKAWYLRPVLLSRIHTSWIGRPAETGPRPSWIAHLVVPAIVALSIVSSVMLFGCGDIEFRVPGAFDSLSTADLEADIDRIKNDGQQVYGVFREDLEPYFMRTSRLWTSRLAGRGWESDKIKRLVTKVGDTWYGEGSGWTPGVGLNYSSFQQCRRPTSYRPRMCPGGAVFERLDGYLTATTANVRCTDSTWKYRITRHLYEAPWTDGPGGQPVRVGALTVKTIPDGKGKFIDAVLSFTEIAAPRGQRSTSEVQIRSILQKPSPYGGSSYIKQIVVVVQRVSSLWDINDPWAPRPTPIEEALQVTVAECEYTGNDRTVHVEARRSNPRFVKIDKFSDRGPQLSAFTMRNPAILIDEHLSAGDGGSVRTALEQYASYIGPARGKQTPELLSRIFTEVMGIYYTLARQQRETLQTLCSPGDSSWRCRNAATYTVVRVGGLGKGWLAVPVVWVVLATIALARLLASVGPLAAMLEGQRSGFLYKPLPTVPREEAERALSLASYPGDLSSDDEEEDADPIVDSYIVQREDVGLPVDEGAAAEAVHSGSRQSTAEEEEARSQGYGGQGEDEPRPDINAVDEAVTHGGQQKGNGHAHPVESEEDDLAQDAEPSSTITTVALPRSTELADRG